MLLCYSTVHVVLCLSSVKLILPVLSVMRGRLRLLIQPIPLKDGPVMEQEPSLRVLWNLFCGGCRVQDNLGEDVVRPSADAAVDIVPYLPGENIGVRALGCQNEMNAESAAKPGNDRQAALYLVYQFFLFLVEAGLVQYLRDFVTGQNIAGLVFACGAVVLVQVGQSRLAEKAFPCVQRLDVLIQQFQQGPLIEAHTALYPPLIGEVHAALEIRDGYLRSLF